MNVRYDMYSGLEQSQLQDLSLFKFSFYSHALILCLRALYKVVVSFSLCVFRSVVPKLLLTSSGERFSGKLPSASLNIYIETHQIVH